MKLAERRTDNDALQCMIKAYEASTQSKTIDNKNETSQSTTFVRIGDDKKVENETSYKLGQAYLEQDDVDSALIYLHKYYDYCQQVNDDEGFGQASESLAICYQKYTILFSLSQPSHSLSFFQKSRHQQEHRIFNQIFTKSFR